MYGSFFTSYLKRTINRSLYFLKSRGSECTPFFPQLRSSFSFVCRILFAIREQCRRKLSRAARSDSCVVYPLVQKSPGRQKKFEPFTHVRPQQHVRRRCGVSAAVQSSSTAAPPARCWVPRLSWRWPASMGAAISVAVRWWWAWVPAGPTTSDAWVPSRVSPAVPAAAFGKRLSRAPATATPLPTTTYSASTAIPCADGVDRHEPPVERLPGPESYDGPTGEPGPGGRCPIGVHVHSRGQYIDGDG
jgi:hypothetical protein